MANNEKIIDKYKAKVTDCTSVSQLQKWLLELECILAAEKDTKIVETVEIFIKEVTEQIAKLEKEKPKTRLQPIIDFIPFFNFFPEIEIELLWTEFSTEKYATPWSPILEFAVKEFKTWLKTKGWKI